MVFAVDLTSGMSLVLLNRLLPYSFRQIDLASGYGGG
jgi:hypothetical protein